MAGAKYVEAGLLLLLLAISCIASVAAEQNPAGESALILETSKSSCPFGALATRIQSFLQQTSIAVSAQWRKATAGSAAVLEASGAEELEEVLETPPQAHPWPEEFTIKFTTKGDLVEGFLAYDWANKRQVIFHGANSTSCTSYGVPNDPCYILFNGTGIFVTLPSLEQSWLETPGVGTVPPDFTVQSVYQGIEFVKGVGPCLAFDFPPTGHAYWETLDGRPCVFVFPLPSMNYYFLPDSEVIGTPDDAYFELPSYYTPTRPSSSSSAT